MTNSAVAFLALKSHLIADSQYSGGKIRAAVDRDLKVKDLRYLCFGLAVLTTTTKSNLSDLS